MGRYLAKVKTMSDFGINEMLEMQKALQEKYKDIWRPICPDEFQKQQRNILRKKSKV